MELLSTSFIMSPSPMAHTQKQGAGRSSKAAVLDAAQRLINQYGYAGFSMRDLAQECGLAKATLYHHFADKRAIFAEVLQRDLAAVATCIQHAANTPGDFATRLYAIATAYFALARARGLLLLSTLRQAADMDAEFCNLLGDYREQVQRPVVELFANAIAAGSIRPIDPDLAALSFIGILQGMTTRHLFMHNLALDESTAAYVVDLMINGLVALPPGTPHQAGEQS